ncbi:hypothetical protein DE146DRAFT_653332 [Phaeosphaeria sp. MPI-PUGE-AT-0046c]|nr:hypothetical protein DE146DRAFT_653332 [Phaeosphaeria sp. MPI-PUGE-AT-0046c]
MTASRTFTVASHTLIALAQTKTVAIEFSIFAPNGTSQHGRQHILCVPARWTTVLGFILSYVIAQAFTLWAQPGEATIERIFSFDSGACLPSCRTRKRHRCSVPTC